MNFQNMNLIMVSVFLYICPFVLTTDSLQEYENK